MLTRVLAGAALAVCLTAAARAEQPEPPAPAPAIDKSADMPDVEGEEPRRKLVKWNEYDGPYSTFRFGFGFLVDYVDYIQDAESEQQFTLDEDTGLRDFRLLFKGKLKTKRPMQWSIGYMYDGADDEWRFRQTGLLIGFPELKGRLFVGRTKEGYSVIKDMVGYHGWTIERSPAEDAFIPILADGVKWMGWFEGPRVYFNAGAFKEFSESEKYPNTDYVFAGRVAWLPILSSDGERLLHVGTMMRIGEPDAGQRQVRSRPESYLTPYFLDTGKFASSQIRTNGIEAYYRSGPWLYGAEYNVEVDDVAGPDPLFHAGDVMVSWNITGETRPYSTAAGLFEAVSPTRTVFEGGPGAWEAVFRFSYSDFDSEGLQGGKFWRFTPMLNWHMSDNIRLEFVYGYGTLDRFDLQGHTQFFQMRLQTSL